MNVGAAATPGIGQRVVFRGDGGTLLGTYLVYCLAPVFAGILAAGLFAFLGGTIGSGMEIVMPLLGFVLLAAAWLVAAVLFSNKFYAFYYEALVLDGQPCQYTGTPGELAKLMVINSLLTFATCGIYSLWAIVRTKEFVYSKVLVGGQPNRLTFHGDPASLLGTYILGVIINYCTLGLYAPWFGNNLIAFMWENTKLDGRAYQFRKDAGGLLGWCTIAFQFSLLTLGVYVPWGICNIFKWEAERVT
jgi:uncharacterized membrane protein YjgN (DUF898 family)